MCRLPNSYNPDRTQCFNAQDEEGFSRCPQQDSLPRRLVGSNGAVRVPHPMMIVAAWLPRCIAPTLHGAMAQVPRWGASAYMIAPIGKTIILWRLMARAFLIHDVTRGLTITATYNLHWLELSSLKIRTSFKFQDSVQATALLSQQSVATTSEECSAGSPARSCNTGCATKRLPMQLECADFLATIKMDEAVGDAVAVCGGGEQ